MRNIVEVHLAGDSTGEWQHSGRISDQQFLVSHMVPLARHKPCKTLNKEFYWIVLFSHFSNISGC